MYIIYCSKIGLSLAHSSCHPSLDCRLTVGSPSADYAISKYPDVAFTSPIQSRGDMRGVWFRVLYDVLRTRSIFRDEDSLSDMGNLCYYADRA